MRREGASQEGLQGQRETFAYDAAANLLDTATSVGQMRHNRLLTYQDKRYRYDGFGRMVEKRSARHGTQRFVDAHGGHEPLARVEGSGALQKIRYYHNDLNGLPEQLTEADGHTVWQARYQVWGNTAEEVREPYFIEEQNLRFQGQYLDRETGLHYNTFRFYDPDVGPFTTPDPIGLAGGINLYAYAPNPVGWVDPLGWKPCFRDTKAQAHAESIIKRHGGVAAGENRYKMPTRRAARQAGSEISGNLGSAAITTRKPDFRGGPRSWHFKRKDWCQESGQNGRVAR